MTIDLNSLDRFIAQVELELERVTADTLRRAALAVDSALVLSTPVDTGRARANWLPSINTPLTTARQNSFDKTGGSAIAEAQATVAGVRFGDTVFISNNLPYIGALNDGHSKQAPAGFVEKAAQVARNV